jgi:hypothetical protein
MKTTLSAYFQVLSQVIISHFYGYFGRRRIVAIESALCVLQDEPEGSVTLILCPCRVLGHC